MGKLQVARPVVSTPTTRMDADIVGRVPLLQLKNRTSGIQMAVRTTAPRRNTTTITISVTTAVTNHTLVRKSISLRSMRSGNEGAARRKRTRLTRRARRRPASVLRPVRFSPHTLRGARCQITIAGCQRRVRAITGLRTARLRPRGRLWGVIRAERIGREGPVLTTVEEETKGRRVEEERIGPRSRDLTCQRGLRLECMDGSTQLTSHGDLDGITTRR